jgi:hypothetical protein
MEILGMLLGLFFLLVVGWVGIRMALALLALPVVIIQDIVNSTKGVFNMLRLSAEDEAHWKKLESDFGMRIDWSMLEQEVSNRVKQNL